MINSRDIADLHPIVRVKCQAFLDDCKAVHPDVRVISTYRDADWQNNRYKIGRTIPGRNVRPGHPMGDVVTNAIGGYSFHQHRVAFDFAPFKPDGEPDWDNEALFDRLGHIGEGLGMAWAGRWIHIKEKGHLQYTGGLTISDFIAGKTLPESP